MCTCEDDNLVLQNLEVCLVDNDSVVHIEINSRERDQQGSHMVDVAGVAYDN
jgi:hypothetical protein